jgi:hypothetical protein
MNNEDFLQPLITQISATERQLRARMEIPVTGAVKNKKITYHPNILPSVHRMNENANMD